MNVFFRACLLLVLGLASVGLAQNMVSSVVKAPIDPTGDVSGRAFDVVINLDRPMSPVVEGRSLLAGKSIRVELPAELVELDVSAFGTPPACGPIEGICNLGILVQGWPQKPVPFGLYSVGFEAPRTVVITANEDIGPGEAGPGIKAIHLNLLGFIQPAAGSYELRVSAETGVDGSLEEGVGRVRVLSEPKPSINVNSVLSDAPGSNLIFQQAELNSETPLPFDFLLWDSAGLPMLGVSVSDDGKSLIREGVVVGTVSWTAPSEASGYKVFSESPSAEINAPISGFPTGHLRVHFLAGSVAGDYEVTFSIIGGNKQTMHVSVMESSSINANKELMVFIPSSLSPKF